MLGFWLEFKEQTDVICLGELNIYFSGKIDRLIDKNLPVLFRRNE